MLSFEYVYDDEDSLITRKSYNFSAIKYANEVINDLNILADIKLFC